MNQYVALLRGINVGGNVLFSAAGGGQAGLTKKIEASLSKTFNYKARVVVRFRKQMKNIIANAPEGFGSDPATYRYDVLFLKEPLTAAKEMKDVTTKDGVDQAFTGKGVLYFSRLVSKASQSYLARIVTMPVYQNMTIRNWNTTTKLLGMMDSTESH